MFAIVYGVVVTLLWAACGVVTLRQPVISHAMYACAWSLVLAWNVTVVVTDIVSYVRKRKHPRSHPR